MRLTLAFCRANPNWIPRKPKHMFHICQNDSVGLLFIAPSQEYCALRCCIRVGRGGCPLLDRSEEHTSELQSLMRISYAVFCLKKKTTIINQHHTPIQYKRHHKMLAR